MSEKMQERKKEPKGSKRLMIGRRTFLLSAASLPAWRQLRTSTVPLAIEEDIGFTKPFHFRNLSTWITPPDEFFVRNHFVQPVPNVRKWKLSISGHVENPLTLTFTDVLQLPAQTQVVTLECTGNPPGGGMVSTGEWTGLSLRKLLEEAGVKPGAREVILVGADEGPLQGEAQPVQFARSIPLSKALDPPTILAHSLGGAELPPSLGFPLRAVVPGWYGANSVKWLTQIIVTEQAFAGFFNTQRYIFVKRGPDGLQIRPANETRVKSQIARPVENSLLSRQPYVIRGAAWSGESPLVRVDVSLDGGDTWQPATLGKEQAPHAWRLWEFQWSNPSSGRHTIGVKATDSKGQTQPSDPDPEELTAYGDNSIHWVKVLVR